MVPLKATPGWECGVKVGKSAQAKPVLLVGQILPYNPAENVLCCNRLTICSLLISKRI